MSPTAVDQVFGAPRFLVPLSTAAAAGAGAGAAAAALGIPLPRFQVVSLNHVGMPVPSTIPGIAGLFVRGTGTATDPFMVDSDSDSCDSDSCDSDGSDDGNRNVRQRIE
jgi:hypothetical protein